VGDRVRSLRGLSQRQNIVRYTNQLLTETDPVKRELLQKLLAEEMVKRASVPPIKT
jgi:hypothetical protein